MFTRRVQSRDRVSRPCMYLYVVHTVYSMYGTVLQRPRVEEGVQNPSGLYMGLARLAPGPTEVA